MDVFNNIGLYAPELVLVLGAMFLLMFGVFGGEKANRLTGWIAVVFLILFSVLGFFVGEENGEAFGGAFILEDFGRYAKFLIGVTAALSLLLARDYLKRERLDKFEFYILALFAVLGMGMMVSANNLLSLYVGLELQSLSLYVMAAFNRDSLRASEAGLKYFVLGALSSGLLLFGSAYIYGFTGHLDFAGIAEAASQGGMNVGLVAGLIFLICGLAFKISAAPFHMWTPDVYEGAPTPVTGFFATAPKMAAMALFARVLLGPFADMVDDWQQALMALAVLSMIVGAFGALVQTNIKRLMAYSSIANMGYALVPLSAGTQAGAEGMLIFMTIYMISVVGVFACILQMRRAEGMVENINDLAGLSSTQRGTALWLTILMFSVMGIPPLAGFFGKWFAFIPAVEAGLIWLVVVALVASVVGAFYYLRIVKIMWVDEADGSFERASPLLGWITTVTAIVIFPLAVIFLGPVREVIATAAGSLF